MHLSLRTQYAWLPSSMVPWYERGVVQLLAEDPDTDPQFEKVLVYHCRMLL